MISSDFVGSVNKLDTSPFLLSTNLIGIDLFETFSKVEIRSRTLIPLPVPKHSILDLYSFKYSKAFKCPSIKYCQYEANLLHAFRH